jgi:hypothetical protein
MNIEDRRRIRIGREIRNNSMPGLNKPNIDSKNINPSVQEKKEDMLSSREIIELYNRKKE